MPIYEYQCDECGASYEVFQKMSDEPLAECEHCGGALRKVLHPVAIHFKGSGFYTTDYGRGSGRRSGARETSGEGDGAAAETASADTKTEKPAPSKGAEGSAGKEKQAAK